MKISLYQFFGIIENFAMSNFRNNHNKFLEILENLHPCNLDHCEPLGRKERAKSLGQKRKKKNDAKHFKARGKEGLLIWCYLVEEIAYSELSTEEKV